MKKRSVIILAFWYLLVLEASAQQLSLSQVLETLQSMEVFKENRDFKEQVIWETTLANDKVDLTIEEYHQLEASYTELATYYNRVYLARIKGDLSNYKQVKRLLRTPSLFAREYTDIYRIVINHYNNEFIPVIRQTNGYRTNTGDYTTLLPLAIKAYEKIVAVISKRKEEQREQIQLIVSTANQLLFKKIELPEWEELGIGLPLENFSENPMQVNNSKIVSTKPTIELLPVSSPLLEGISGRLSFYQYDKITDGLQQMEFIKGETMITEVNDYGNSATMFDQIAGKPSVMANQSAIMVSHFETTQRYSSGTYYKLNIEGDGLVYAFAVNSGNRMYCIYPYQRYTSEIKAGTNFMLPTNADQIISYSKEKTNKTIVNIPNEENFILITDDIESSIPKSETLVVLFSRSELDIKTVLEQMEKISDTISIPERLAKIFGSQAATPQQANVSFEQGNFHFHLLDDNSTVLPLTFSILRQ